MKENDDKHLYYDFEKINKIPLEEICKAKGIELKKKGNSLFGNVRNERTASLSVNPSKGVWKDFGTGEGGKTAISLMQYLENEENFQVAAEHIAELFNIQPENGEKRFGLAKKEYEELELNTENALLNYPIINLEKQTIEEAEELSKKYNISMQQLANEDKKLHDAIVKEAAFKLISNERIKFSKYNNKFNNLECNNNIIISCEKFKIGKLALESKNKNNHYIEILSKCTKKNYPGLKLKFNEKLLDETENFIHNFCRNKTVDELEIILKKTKEYNKNFEKEL